MPIEKAFAIKAPPDDIWRALNQELASAGEDGPLVERADPPRLLSLRLEVAGIRSVLTYRITPGPEHTEVTARLEPMGFRYLLFQALTLGRFGTGFEVLLVQGLANLKAAVEGTAVNEKEALEEPEDPA